MTPAISVDRLTFRYRGRKRPCLRDVSLDIPCGQTVLLLGPSGCGKSTLALCLNGMVPHLIDGELSGTVRIHGNDTRAQHVAATTREVGIVFQDPETQFCTLRVDDEIAFGLENLRVPRQEMPDRIAGALAATGLDCPPSTRVDRLSGGNKQRLALACVLAMRPSVLVFDEPTSNLDPSGASDVVDTIARLKAMGDHTMVVIEHRLDRLMGLVDRVVVFGPDGSIQADGEPHEVLEEHEQALDRDGIWIPQATELVKRLRAGGIKPAGYAITLEEAAEVLKPFASRMAATSPDELLLRNATHIHKNGSGLNAGPAVLSVDGLSYRYPHGTQALRDVSLRVESGDFFAIAGPNGAGKSTFAHHLIATMRPARGAVSVAGHDLHGLPASQLSNLVGYVFQNPEHQFVERTVFDELAFGPRLRHMPELDVRRRVEAMLASFGLVELGPANPFRLSHGEKRRLSVATMLILGQKLLVLDEPTFGQDRRNSTALLALLHELNRAGRTIIMITHDMRLVAEHARHAAVLVEGGVAYHGPARPLFDDETLLSRAHLEPPPILALSRDLFPKWDARWGDLPATVDDLTTLLVQRLAPQVVAT